MDYSITSFEKVDNLKSIVKSASTGAKSSEEVLENLHKFGVEWHVTEEGTLMIRYWQVGAENFVHPEQAAIIRTRRPFPKQGDKLDWLSKNLQNIHKEYGGQWIAVYENEIVAKSSNLPDLMTQITEFDSPLITFIPVEPVVWTFTYAS